MADGTIVVGSDAGKVFALDPADGHIRWLTVLFNFVQSSPALGRDGTVYVGAHTDRLHALDGRDGRELWSFDTSLDITSSPVIAGDGTIYFGSENGNLYALAPNGVEKWSYWTGGLVKSSPALGPDGTIYVGSDSGFVFAVRPDGSLKWQSQWLSRVVRSSPAVAGELVYVGSDANKLHALRTADGSIAWERDFFLSDVSGSPTLGPDGTIYIGADDGALHAFDPGGTERWSFPTGGPIRSSAIVDERGTLYFGSDDGYLYALRPDGALVWKYKTWGHVRSSPAIGLNGELIVGSLDSRVYSIGSSDRVADSDCDHIPDARERSLGLDPRSPLDAKEDSDGDGVDNALEAALGGNPFALDSDGDGAPDDPDLFGATDFDGDGVAFAADNCPGTGNPRQEDLDGNGVGDLCAASVPVAVARTADGHYAAVRSDVQNMARLERDQHGLSPTGTSFRLFAEPPAEGRELIELWHSGSRVHAYASTPSELDALRARGHRVVGSLGYLSSSPSAAGETAPVRHFRRGEGDDALTINAEEGAALSAAGYQELASPGYGLQDYGDLRTPEAVVRFRNPAAGQVLHTASSLQEGGLAGYATEGPQFAVLPSPNGWTVPLRRLRSAAGDEVLSADVSETLPGYTLEGIVGHVFRAGGPVSSAQVLVPLYRLTAPSGAHEHRVSSAEAQALVARGFTLQVIARVAALPAPAAGGQCVGAPSTAEELAASYVNLPPEQRAGAVLMRLVYACSALRALAGAAATDVEQRFADYISRQNAELQDELRQEAHRTLSLTAAERAPLLGELAFLDPGDCSAPIAEQRIASALQALWEPSATTGGTTPRSLARLRAPQCEGVSYAPGSVGQEDGARAIVATDDSVSNCAPQGEFNVCDPVGGVLAPTLYGVTSEGSLPAGSPAEQYVQSHPRVGAALQGYDLGPCTLGCDRGAGQRCVANRCFQYPIVPHGSQPIFSASNVWDIVSPELEFQELDPDSGAPVGDRIRQRAEPHIIPYGANEDMALRCDPYPVRGAEAKPAEERLELLAPAGNLLQLASGKFYRVRAINNNGTYFRAGDVRPLDVAQWPATARTVHLCVSPGCEPLPTSANAACEQAELPSCAGALGVVWTTPPRSLEECQQLDPLETHTVCPETPHEFVSEPGIIYVADPEQKRFVQTRLKGIDCVNETGRTNRPNVNPDEVVVAFTSVSTDLASLKDLEDEHGFGVIKMNLNAGDKRRPDDVIGSVPVGLGDTATGVLMVGEDDVYSPKIWIRSHLAGILASMVGFNAGGPIGAVAAGASTEFGTALLLSVLDKPDPDDPIGRAAWSSTVAQIDVRGTASHDSDLSNAVPALVRKEELLEHIRAGTAGVHPAVDLIAYSANDQLLSCAMDGECESGRRCYLGACVPMGWSDPTLPLEYDPASDVAGTIERWDMDGSRSDYRVYVSTSVSAKNRP